MALVIKDTDVPGTVEVVISFKDSKGKLAKVDGIPTWTASDPSVIDTVTPTADGLSATLHITDNIGASQLTVNADVDMGSGTNNVDFVDTVSVIAGDAVSGEFTFGTVKPDTVTPPGVPPIATTFPDAASLTAAVTAYQAAGGKDGFTLDGATVGADGTSGTVNAYFTAADGHVDMTPPASSKPIFGSKKA